MAVVVGTIQHMANTVVTSACSEHKAQGMILVEKQPFSGILKVTFPLDFVLEKITLYY